MAATESLPRILQKAGCTNLAPLLKEEALEDVKLLKSMGADVLFQSLQELGVEAKAATALTAALFPELAWDEPCKGSDSDDEWLLVGAEGKFTTASSAAAADSEEEDLQLEENAASDEEDGPLLEDNACETGGATPADDDDDDDELELEDNAEAEDDELMLEDNATGGR